MDLDTNSALITQNSDPMAEAMLKAKTRKIESSTATTTKTTTITTRTTTETKQLTTTYNSLLNLGKTAQLNSITRIPFFSFKIHKTTHLSRKAFLKLEMRMTINH